MQLDFEAIKTYLPQRFPFIMLDKVIELEPGKRAVGIKNISGNDIFFLGHFPDRAVMPGAAIIEAMAQTAIVLFASAQQGHKNEKKPVYLFGSVKARFLHTVVPGDQLMLTVENTKSLPTGAYVTAVATVEGKKVSEADLIFSVQHE
jgi:3-hydroxyacyl-[acyl-carrier-protein] dehydratase